MPFGITRFIEVEIECFGLEWFKWLGWFDKWLGGFHLSSWQSAITYWLTEQIVWPGRYP